MLAFESLLGVFWTTFGAQKCALGLVVDHIEVTSVSMWSLKVDTIAKNYRKVSIELRTGNNKLAKKQFEIMSAIWPTLKPDGVLLYITCSVLPEENDLVIEKFIKFQKDVKVSQIEINCGISTKYGKQLFPEKNAHDGFYYARLIKV